MFLLLDDRHVGAPRKGTNMASLNSSINLGENTGMKNRTDLNRGGMVYKSIIYHIPDS